MKILVLNGSPRKNGHTRKMLDAFCQEASARHTINTFDVCSMDIHGCMACESCHTKGSRQCVLDDDMQKIYPLLDEADMLVIGSPIYYHSYSGQMQCTLNRIYSLDKPAALKKTALFLSAGDTDAFDSAVWSYKHNFPGYLKTEDAGIFTTSGDDDPSDELLDAIRKMAASL